MDASEPHPDGTVDYRYEYDLLRFREGEHVLVARSYSDSPSEVHFLRAEHGSVARRLDRTDVTSVLAMAAVAHLRTLGKTEIRWLSGAGDGYEAMPSASAARAERTGQEALSAPAEFMARLRSWSGRSRRTSGSSSRHRVVAAFALAPGVPALIVAAPAALAGASWSATWSLLAMASLVTYAHALLLGLPVAWLLDRIGRLTLRRVVVAGFAIGALPFAGFTLSLEATMPAVSRFEADGVVLRSDGGLTAAGLQSSVIGILGMGVLGAIAAFVWWLVARPGNGRLRQ